MFAIRKRPEMIFRLDGEPGSYVETGVMTAAQAAVIRQAVIDRQNIVVAGGTGSGKTTLLNAILAEDAFREDRVVIIEDTRELQCSTDDRVQLLTKPGPNPVRMSDLVFDVLRLRPDRIIADRADAPEGVEYGPSWGCYEHSTRTAPMTLCSGLKT